MASVFSPTLLGGQVALVTGGGSGIGLGISAALLAHGCDVAILSRSLERLEKAAAGLRAGAPGRRCLVVRADVRRPAEVDEAVARVLAELGRIDVLVNGAAGNFLCPAAGLSTRSVQTVMEIDAIGTFTVTRAVYGAWMREHGGSVINITATLHWNGELFQVHAGMAKSAIESMARHLANEWGPRGVRVNNVAPGPIANTEGFSRLGGFLPSDVIERWRSGIPLQRWGTVEDCAMAVVFLASGRASGYVTGSTIVVDGGAWMAGVGKVAESLPDMRSKM